MSDSVTLTTGVKVDDQPRIMLLEINQGALELFAEVLRLSADYAKRCDYEDCRVENTPKGGYLITARRKTEKTKPMRCAICGSEAYGSGPVGSMWPETH